MYLHNIAEAVIVSDDFAFCRSLLSYYTYYKHERLSGRSSGEHVFKLQKLFSSEESLIKIATAGFDVDALDIVACSVVSVSEIVAAVKREENIILLLDLDYSGLDGLNVVEELKLCGLSEHVILLSCGYTSLQRRIISSLGASYFFTKPIEEVSVVIKRICECAEMLSDGGREDALWRGGEVEEEEGLSFVKEEAADERRELRLRTTQLLHEIGVPANLCGHDI